MIESFPTSPMTICVLIKLLSILPEIITLCTFNVLTHDANTSIKRPSFIFHFQKQSLEIVPYYPAYIPLILSSTPITPSFLGSPCVYLYIILDHPHSHPSSILHTLSIAI